MVNMKKITSLVLVFSMVLTVFIVPSVAYNEQTEVVVNVANNFDIAIEKKGNTRTAVVTDLNKGTVDVVSINDETGVTTINGEVFSPIVNTTYIYSPAVHSVSSEDNWTTPQTNIISLSLGAFAATAIIGYLNLKYGIPSDKATYIAGLVIGGSGFLYVKSVTQFNYVDYGTKVGYRLTESFHLKADASDAPLYTRTMTGSR